jgi:hypothetical protein
VSGAEEISETVEVLEDNTICMVFGLSLPGREDGAET